LEARLARKLYLFGGVNGYPVAWSKERSRVFYRMAGERVNGT
jgi:hypothetical protein